MIVAGLERCSFVDWPGRMTAVFFAPGCNLNCYYCHNRELLGTVHCGQDSSAYLEWLSERRSFLDGVVITGGEPTLQEGLADFIREVRRIGFPVKLDTNGTRPAVLQSLLKEGLLDYVAMDLKAPERLYSDVCGVSIDGAVITRSIQLILETAPDYEFRTTVLPGFSVADLEEMAERIGGARHYYLQQYRKPAGMPGVADIRVAREPHSHEQLRTMQGVAARWVGYCELRGTAPEQAAQLA